MPETPSKRIKLCCPTCGRFLQAVTQPVTVGLIGHCRNCKQEIAFDLVVRGARILLHVHVVLGAEEAVSFVPCQQCPTGVECS